MSAKNAGWPFTQALSNCDSCRGRARSDCKSDEVHESSFPYLTAQCWHRLSHWDEHPASRCGIFFEWVCFQVLHTSTLRYSETSLCLIPCLRLELVGAECCDIHAVLCLPLLLDCVTQQHCFQLLHGAFCFAPGRLWYLVCKSSTHLRCDSLEPHFVRLRACVPSWFVLNVVTFRQFLCRPQRHSLRADCGISQVL